MIIFALNDAEVVEDNQTEDGENEIDDRTKLSVSIDLTNNELYVENIT